MQRRMNMRRFAPFLILLLFAAACGDSNSPTSGPTSTTTGPTTTSAPGPEAASPGALAAAVLQLVTVDHTFGEGPPPFTDYLILSDIDPNAGADGTAHLRRPLSPDERSAIETAVTPLGKVTWIDEAEDWITDDLGNVLEGSVIVGVGEPTIEGTSALVPVSLWCGGLCGTWLTYQVEWSDGAWRVAGITGPVAIS